MKTLLLFTVAVLCFGATESRVPRKAMAAVESSMNKGFRTVTNDPYDLLGTARGTYLNGYGAVLATSGNPDAKIQELMAKMKPITEKPLDSYSQEWKFLTQHLVEIQPTQKASAAPAGMVLIPGATFDFKVEGIEIEGSDDREESSRREK